MLFFSPHKGNLLGNLAFQCTELNICITQTNSVSIWAEMWVLSEHRVQSAVFFWFFFRVRFFLCATPTGTEHTLIQILLKNHCSKNVSPWQNDHASTWGRYLCEQSLWGNTFRQSVLGCEWFYCSTYTVPNGTTGWWARTFGHSCSISYWFYCGWTSWGQEEYIYMVHYLV